MTRPKDARATVWDLILRARYDTTARPADAELSDALDTYATAVREQAINDVMIALDPVVVAVEATEDPAARLALAWVLERISAERGGV